MTTRSLPWRPWSGSQNPNACDACAIFPEHHGHIHELRCDDIKFESNERDVAFHRDGEVVATVVPYAEAGLDTQDVQDALAGWSYMLGRYTNTEQFAEFFRRSVGGAAGPRCPFARIAALSPVCRVFTLGLVCP